MPTEPKRLPQHAAQLLARKELLTKCLGDWISLCGMALRIFAGGLVGALCFFASCKENGMRLATALDF